MSRNYSDNGWTLTSRIFPPGVGLTGYVVSFESRCFEILNLVVMGAGRFVNCVPGVSPVWPVFPDELVVFCPLTPFQEDVYQTLLQNPDVEMIRKKNFPCDCGSGEDRGKCCFTVSENLLNHWHFLITRKSIIYLPLGKGQLRPWTCMWSGLVCQ